MNISFYPGSEGAYEKIQHPVPAKSIIPKWYKDITPESSLNVKNCIPFLDGITSGYVQLTWEDIYVENIKNKLNIFTKGETGLPMFNVREKSDINISKNFHSIEFIWNRHWSIKMPKGYSGLITHPINRYDLPFVTLSGIVDFDIYNHSRVGNMPFYLYKDFEGVIPKGTPMFQIIPIKRENWTSTKEIYDEQSWVEKEKKRFSIDRGAYKKMFWQKKSFD